MYVPSFLEIYLAYGLLLGGWWWLTGRVALPRALSILPWSAGALVLVGQLLAVGGMMQSSPTQTPEGASMMLDVGRYGSAGAVVVAWLLLIGIAVWALALGGGSRPREA